MLDIDLYLEEKANRAIVGEKFITWFKEKHKTRDIPKHGRYTRHTDYTHGSHPYCKICNEDLEIGDEIFLFYIYRWQVPYHVSCFLDARESKQRNIIYQDRSMRKKLAT